MRVVPKSNGSADDNSQKFWVFGPSFVQTPTEISSSSSTSSSEEDRKPPRPPRPPLLLAMPAFKFKGKKRSGKTIRIPTEKVKKKKKKEEKGNGKQEGCTSKSRNRSRASKERWTAERYERASLMVINVMRQKAAELGTRITRKDLRDEARKHIGDTGLLDHLLKHMAGKVVGDRGERFMRGFTSDGLML
ncbi:uncharacterized protein A4U43_C08F26330 [Asparagus officinalis]|nr:uncharacterized protein A4U43_C08F26330 [Asparagus officinalis]